MVYLCSVSVSEFYSFISTEQGVLAMHPHYTIAKCLLCQFMKNLIQKQFLMTQQNLFSKNGYMPHLQNKKKRIFIHLIRNRMTLKIFDKILTTLLCVLLFMNSCYKSNSKDTCLASMVKMFQKDLKIPIEIRVHILCFILK